MRLSFFVLIDAITVFSFGLLVGRSASDVDLMNCFRYHCPNGS